MSIFSGLEKIVEKDYALAKQTWYGLGGLADYFIRPQTVEQLGEAAGRCRENNIAMKVMGYGSNLLIGDDGVRGAVVKLEADVFKQTEFDGTNIKAWAGSDLRQLVLECTRKGLSGLEAMTGIPGSIGGAVRMNAGGSFGDIGAVVESVTLMDYTGKIFQRRKPDLVFDYRNTNVTAPFVLSADLKLHEGDREQILRMVQEIWIYKKNNQPLNTKNSGCIFKNPRGVSAGAMIDRTGLKGLRIGGAVVSDKHANFIIAEEGCTAKDVCRLMDAVRQRVKEKFDIELELEIEIWD